ncbi:MAG: hypothetical protein OCC46_02410 [Pseudodesulfovibrio sp.]
MNTNKRENIHRLLKTAHTQRDAKDLTPAWRNSVMAEVSRIGKAQETPSELERLAPRFTLVAAALSILLIFIATWSLGDLPSELSTAYASQVFGTTPTTWTSL